MEQYTLPTGESWQLIETTEVGLLIVEEGASITAPEGKAVTIIVDGIEQPLMPGAYKNVTLALSEPFRSPVKGYQIDGYRAALYIEDGKVCPERSVPSAAVGGTYDGKAMDGVSFVSKGNLFNGLVVKNGEYTLKNITTDFTGYGQNDFCGKGAALLFCGDAKVTLDGAKLESRGVLRPTIVAGDHAEVTVKNSDIMVYGGSAEEEAELRSTCAGVMLSSVPWMLGLRGSARATNAVSGSKVTYESSSIRSEGWGVLSTDGVENPTTKDEPALTLTARNCLVEVTGDSGYGAYSIGACKDVFEGCTINVPDYALVVANETAGGSFKNTVVNSGRFGVMWHQNQGGKLELEDSVFHTGMTTFLVKSCYPNISVRNSVIRTDNGVILQMMDLDDPGMGPMESVVDQAVPVKVEDHDLTIVNRQDVKMSGFTYEDYATDLQASFADMSLQGDFYNAITNACGVGMLAGDPPEDGNDDVPPGAPSAPPADGDTPPGAPPSGPDGGFVMPPPSTERPVNMALRFSNVSIKGVISASTAKHSVGLITPDNREELGMVTNTVCPAVNNGVLVTLEQGSKWEVTGTSYLTRLEISQDSQLLCKPNKQLVLTVDGKETPIASGVYTGNLCLALR